MVWIYAGVTIWLLVVLYYLYRADKRKQAAEQKRIKQIAYDKLTQDLSSYIEYRLKEARPTYNTIKVSIMGSDKKVKGKRPKLADAIWRRKKVRIKNARI